MCHRSALCTAMLLLLYEPMQSAHFGSPLQLRVPGNCPSSLPCYDPSLISPKKSKRHLQTRFILFIYPPLMHILELFIPEQATRYYPVQEKTSYINIVLLGYSYMHPPCVFRASVWELHLCLQTPQRLVTTQ